MSLDLKITNLKVLPSMFSETVKDNDKSVSLSIGPIPLQSIHDSSAVSTTAKASTLLGGAKKRTVRPKVRKCRKQKGGDDVSSATNELIADIEKVKESEVKELSPMLSLTSLKDAAVKTADSVRAAVVDTISSPNPMSTETEKLVENLRDVAVSGINKVASKITSFIPGKKEEKEEEDTVSALLKTQNEMKEESEEKKLCGGKTYYTEDTDELDEVESESEDSGVEIDGGAPKDFNDFIGGLWKKSTGGKKRVYSKEATEFNDKTTEVIKSVYPDINKEELKAVRSEIYQTIRAKYEPEVFKTLKDFEKSELLFKATTPAVVKKIDPAKAVEERKKRLENIFGKREETPTNDAVEEKKEKKEEKKTTKKKTTKKTAKRGGAVSAEQSLELPFMIDGGCNCGM